MIPLNKNVLLYYAFLNHFSQFTPWDVHDTETSEGTRGVTEPDGDYAPATPTRISVLFTFQVLPVPLQKRFLVPENLYRSHHRCLFLRIYTYHGLRFASVKVVGLLSPISVRLVQLGYLFRYYYESTLFVVRAVPFSCTQRLFQMFDKLIKLFWLHSGGEFHFVGSIISIYSSTSLLY